MVQGDGGLKLSDDYHRMLGFSSTEDHSIGASLEHSLKHAHMIFHLKEDIPFYFHSCLMKNDMLECCSLEILGDCSGDSTSARKLRNLYLFLLENENKMAKTLLLRISMVVY